jgi:glucose/arabinose dehydrogenase
MRIRSWSIALIAGAAVAAGCEMAKLPVDAGVGDSPPLPPNATALFATVDVADAKGWPPGAAPSSPAGLAVNAFASGLEHPRWLHVLPNGDVLVAETTAPPRPDDGKGLKGFVMKLMMKRAGAAVPSPNRITLLRDADGDGVAELRTSYIEGLDSPFGMALVGDTLYVANTDAVVKFPYVEGATRITSPPVRVADLPGGPLNHHWTKNIAACPDGRMLYATVG